MTIGALLGLISVVIVCLFCVFFYQKLEQLSKTDLRAIPALIEERFLTFKDEVMASLDFVSTSLELPSFDFNAILASPEVEQKLAEITMNSIMTLTQDEEVQTYLKTLIASFTQALNPMGQVGLPPQTEEEAQATQAKVQEFTKEMAMGVINEAMPIGLAGYLDKKQDGWRDWLGDDPHALLGVAKFLTDIGAKEKVEGVVGDFIKNLTGGFKGSSPSSPTHRTKSEGVVG